MRCPYSMDCGKHCVLTPFAATTLDQVGGSIPAREWRAPEGCGRQVVFIMREQQTQEPGRP